MIVFAGTRAPSTVTNDVWVLTNANGLGGTPQWSFLAPSGGPPAARNVHRAIYDQASNRMTIFGGAGVGIMHFDDVWVLTQANGLGGTPQWTQLTPTGTSPSARFGHSAVYVAPTNIMIVLGGSPFTGGFEGWLLFGANGT